MNAAVVDVEPAPSLPVGGLEVRADDAMAAWDNRMAAAGVAVDDTAEGADDGEGAEEGEEPSDWRITLATFGIFAGGLGAMTLLVPSLPMVGLLVGATLVMGAETGRQKRRFERWHRRLARRRLTEAREGER
jgi:hypothetical protein